MRGKIKNHLRKFKLIWENCLQTIFPFFVYLNSATNSHSLFSDRDRMLLAIRYIWSLKHNQSFFSTLKSSKCRMSMLTNSDRVQGENWILFYSAKLRKKLNWPAPIQIQQRGHFRQLVTHIKACCILVHRGFQIRIHVDDVATPLPLIPCKNIFKFEAQNQKRFVNPRGPTVQDV